MYLAETGARLYTTLILIPLILRYYTLEDFLIGPITASVFTKEYCVEFPKEHDIVVCQAMIDDLESVDRNLELETRWAAQKLSGVDDAEASGYIGSPNLTTDWRTGCQGSLTMVRKARAETPWLRYIRPYHIAEAQGIPGLKN